MLRGGMRDKEMEIGDFCDGCSESAKTNKKIMRIC